VRLLGQPVRGDQRGGAVVQPRGRQAGGGGSGRRRGAAAARAREQQVAAQHLWPGRVAEHARPAARARADRALLPRLRGGRQARQQ